MAEPQRSVWFAGDLEDPWVSSLADALSGLSARVSCPGDLPDDWPGTQPAPDVLVLHRAILTGHDFEWLRRLQERNEPAPQVFLCFGPHARYSELVRWSSLVAAAVPEATALDTLPRRLLGEGGNPPRPSGPRPLVWVASTLHDLRQVLALACESAGYSVRLAHDPSEVPPGPLAVWDVPVLEPAWRRALAALAGRGPVVALIGFADREQVAQARAQGASACLDLPCDVADLTFALDRLALEPSATRGANPPHPTPPPPHSPHPQALPVAIRKHGA